MRRSSEEAQNPVHMRRPWSCGWSAQGVIGALEPFVNDARKARLRSVIDARLSSVTVLMDAPHDPHNGAAVLRSCDAFGVAEVHVLIRRFPFLASNVVSKGAERWVDVIEHDDPPATVAALRARDFELVATHPQGELLPEDLRHIPRLALVLGNERHGIGGDIMQSAGRSVRIPMVGFVESLNVSVSAAILLRAATEGRAGDLGFAERRELYAQGLYRSVKQAEQVLGASRPQ